MNRQNSILNNLGKTTKFFSFENFVIFMVVAIFTMIILANLNLNLRLNLNFELGSQQTGIYTCVKTYTETSQFTSTSVIQTNYKAILKSQDNTNEVFNCGHEENFAKLENGKKYTIRFFQSFDEKIIVDVSE